MSESRDELLRGAYHALDEARKAIVVSMHLLAQELRPSGILSADGEEISPGCPHLNSEDVSTGGGGPRRALCFDCNETFTVGADEPAETALVGG
jgi:transposase-like protein